MHYSAVEDQIFPRASKQFGNERVNWYSTIIILLLYSFFFYCCKGLLGKSKGQTTRVATVLHVLFGIDHEYTVSSTITDAAVKAALDIVRVCNEHTAQSIAVLACKSNVLVITKYKIVFLISIQLLVDERVTLRQQGKF